MPSSKAMRLLATSPKHHLEWLTTGRVPQGIRPRSPLIDLLKQLSPRDRMAIRGVTVGPSLGYTGSRQFHTAEQAFKWVYPDDEVFGSFPAESWRDKRFNRILTLDDLLESASAYPDSLTQHYARLRRRS